MTTPLASDDLDEQDAPGGLRRQVEEANAAARQAKAEADAAKRELAFAKAGLDLNDPKMSYFVKGYDGEPDPEAIKAAALAAGFLAPPDSQVPASELAQHQAAANLAAGAGAETHTGPLWIDNPEYEAAMARATSKEEVKAVMRQYGSPIDDGID